MSIADKLQAFGFGSKAGIVPLHVWLPRAHPAAPSHVSALMSGVMIKMGVYGLLRVALDPQGPSIGPVSVTVYDVPADATTSATLGGPAVTVTTGVPGQNASVTFTGNAGDGVAALVGPFNCCSTQVSLLAPGGAVVAGPISFNPDGGRVLARLPSAGTYSLFVDPQGSATGAVHLQLTVDNTAPAPPQLTLTESAPDSSLTGTTLFYRPDGAGGSFTVPDHGDGYRFELTLTATDRGGQPSSTVVTIEPQTVQITLATSPPGLAVVYTGERGVAPRDPAPGHRGCRERGIHQGLHAPAPVPARPPVRHLALPSCREPRRRSRPPRPQGARPGRDARASRRRGRL